MNHKQIKIEVEGQRVVNVPLCNVELEGSTKYRWEDVDCVTCWSLKGTLKDKAREQMKQWRKENKLND